MTNFYDVLWIRMIKWLAKPDGKPIHFINLNVIS